MVSEPREYSLWFADYGPKQGRRYPWEGRLPETQGGVKQRFERAAYRLHWHERVRCELLLAGWRPSYEQWNELALDYTRCASGKRPDYANVVWSAKAILDGLQGRLIAEDDDAHIPLQTYRHAACKRADQGVRLKLLRLA